MLLLLLPPHPSLLPGGSAVSAPRRLRARAVRMEPDDGGQAVFDDLGEKQVYGPTKPAHAWPKPWTNLETQEHVQVVKAASGLLQEPLRTDMGDDEIFVGKDSIHILKHHGSYMQQDRSLKGKDKQHSYQFMLRLKMPCGEAPAKPCRRLQILLAAFQLHGVLKGNLKSVIASIANIGSNTYGGCGDISRNVMTPPVSFPNNPAYEYCGQYARAMAELFKPMTQAFYEIWLDGQPADKTESSSESTSTRSNLVRTEDRGNGIITGHAALLDAEVALPAFQSKTLKGFNIVVGGGMGRTHKAEQTFARAASHLGFAPKEHFFEAMKAILAVRSNARLKYLVHTLGIDDFRTLTEKYYGRRFEPWVPLPEWKYLDWMGWHEQARGGPGAKGAAGALGECLLAGPQRASPPFHPQPRPQRLDRTLSLHAHAHPQGDGRWMLGVNVEQGRSVVLRNIAHADRENLESLLRFHGVETDVAQIDPITRKSIACPAFPLCGLAITEAERVQPQINARLWALLCEMGLSNTDFVTRTTGCPNGCARPYMAELAFVGSGPDMYQVWVGGHPAQSERTAVEVPSLFKMKLDDLEATMEPIFAMYKTQRLAADEAFGNFCYRVGVPAIEEYIAKYELGSWRAMGDPFGPEAVATDATVGITSDVLAKVEEEASKRGYDAPTLIDALLREALAIE
ncbi:ferredoxin-sulfite reductase [Emiliania huxleyi CCMP1516]|uniref:Nitrite/sulphite reductase 4Fe-4S domain-containing protein n=2 Tax=Emiliania huxleyi TaxID=2903 RepID=A0A0D3INP7_EMIH1|nr:ferredoxin-sulfite reductase [Emiliania huxleyi CCMP1516]EOD12882.1 ferredoxin-sulfite reductase [Emiliania huxleyi CCMP1516]|eukprot:XP_005765311.1 ferredoxin-sulfite reductase [Emiliania huxleyi CCMP1516]